MSNLVMENAFVDFNRRLGILASGDYSVSPQVFERIVRDNVTGTPVENSSKIQEVFFDNVRMYLVDTNQAMLLNDVTNTNTFLRDSIGKELEKNTTLRDKTFNQIHKTRHNYLNKRYTTKNNQFVASLLQATIFVVLVLGCLFAMLKDEQLGQNTVIIIASVLVAFYLLIMILFLKQNQLRRKDDWDKFYFPGKNDGRSGTCKK